MHPPSASRRSAIPCRPVPLAVAAGSNPRPSSVISKDRWLFTADTLSRAEVALEYLAMFCRASRQQK